MLPMECPNCHRKVNAQDSFCGHCGFPLKRNVLHIDDPDIAAIAFEALEANSAIAHSPDELQIWCVELLDIKPRKMAATKVTMELFHLSLREAKELMDKLEYNPHAVIAHGMTKEEAEKVANVYRSAGIISKVKEDSEKWV